MEQADLYAEANYNQYKDAAEILIKYKDKLIWNEDESILDIGCGPGNVTANLILPITPQSAKTMGCDISMNMIKFARKNFENDRLKFTPMNICADNAIDLLGEEKFDKVFSFYCLHWIPDQRKVAENIWKLMKPNGIALIVLLSHSQIYTIYKWLSNETKWREYMTDVDKYFPPYQNANNPSDTYSNLMKSVGFNVIECYTKMTPVHSSSVHSFKKALAAVNPFINRIPTDKRKEYMECIINRLVDQQIIKVEKMKDEEHLIIPPNKILITLCQKVKLQ